VHGVGAFDQVALQKKLTGKSVRVTPFISSLEEGFSGTASPKDAETMFELIHLYVTAPRPDTVGWIDAPMARRVTPPWPRTNCPALVGSCAT
jgi:hypothetical protein